MQAKINGTNYNTERAEYIANNPSPDGEDTLYRSKRGKFFLLETVTYVDGIRLNVAEWPEDRAPELAFGGNWHESTETIHTRRRERIEHTQRIIALTEREALRWCVKTQLPECFLPYVLDSI